MPGQSRRPHGLVMRTLTEVQIMSTAKHTPGPWVIKPARTLLHINGPQGEYICSMSKAGLVRFTPNAALISAAPELLEALRQTERLADELMQRCNRLDALLLEANHASGDGIELGEVRRMRAQFERNAAAIAKAEGRS